MSSSAVKLVIVEDHLMFREVLRKLCETEFHFAVVGEASSGTEAVRIINATRPDIVILDLNLPDGDGFDVLEQIQPALPLTKFLILSSNCSDYTLFRVEKAQVQGFVDKSTQSVTMLRDALNAIRSGRCYFSQAYLEAKTERRRDTNSYIKILTDREREVLALIGQSMTDQEIADKLGISWKTSETHRGMIIRKLGIPTTPKLIRFAIEIGLTRLPLPPQKPGGAA